MTNGWQEVPLKEVAKPISRPVPVEAGATYRTLGVKWWGMGAYERESIDGSRTAAKTLSIVREGDLIINKIWVRHGSVAIAGKDVDGCAGSGEFPTFELDLNRIDPRWIHWQTKMRSFWEKCDDLSRGTSGKNRIKPELFLTINIPLPPLTEQRRIVTHIESLAARVNEALHLREEADSETEKFIASVTNQLFTELSEKYNPIAIGKTFTFRQDLIRPTDGKSGKIRFIGLQHVESNTGRRIGEDALYAEQLTGRKFYFSPGEIVYGYLRPYLNKVWIADCEGVCSVDQYVIRPNEKIIDTKYLAYFMRSPAFLHKAIEMTHNLLLPRLRTGLLESILIPVPPLDEQRRIVAYLDGLQAKINALRELQSQSQEELDALLPSVLDKAFRGEL